MATDRRILNSWKEIANYMRRGVRTVQRWERHFHLPVHRPAGHDRSAVIAFSDEVDDWLASTPVKIRPLQPRQRGLPPRTRELLESVRTRTLTLIRSAEKLQSSVIHAQEQQERRQQRKKLA